MSNLNYPDYSSGFGGYGRKPKPPNNDANYAQGVGGGAAGGAAAGTAVMPGWGTLAGAVAGAGLGAYGAYEQGEQADQDYAQQMRAYNDDQERQRRMEEDARYQAELQGKMGAASYARGMQNDREQAYSPWARRLGL